MMANGGFLHDSTVTNELASVDLAPRGVLRAALNLGNPNLVTQSPTGGFSGLSVDLATELAASLRLPIEFVSYRGAGSVVEAASSDAWDIAFLAIDPLRADLITFTSPYLTLAGSFVVRKSSRLTANQEVDREGVRIVVGASSAYDLYLTKTIKRATLYRVPASSDVLPVMVRDGYEVAAGVRQQLEQHLNDYKDLRILDGKFMTIPQALAVPKGHALALAFVQTFIEAMKASGFIKRSLYRHNVTGIEVAGLA